MRSLRSAVRASRLAQEGLAALRRQRLERPEAQFRVQQSRAPLGLAGLRVRDRVQVLVTRFTER